MCFLSPTNKIFFFLTQKWQYTTQLKTRSYSSNLMLFSVTEVWPAGLSWSFHLCCPYSVFDHTAEKHQVESVTGNRTSYFIFCSPVMHKMWFLHCALTEHRNSTRRNFPFLPSPLLSSILFTWIFYRIIKLKIQQRISHRGVGIRISPAWIW